MPKNQNTYHENFIEGVRIFMAVNKIDSIKSVYPVLGIAYMSLCKIMDGSNKPTVDQGVLLCNKCGYSGNWLFLSKGEMYYQKELESMKISKELKALRELISTK